MKRSDELNAGSHEPYRIEAATRMNGKRHNIFRAAALLGLVLLIAGSVTAQKKVRLNSAPKAFRDFYAKFAATARRGDVKAIATMTHFPFHYGFDAGDEGYWTKAEFTKQFGDVLMPQPVVFKEKNPTFTVQGGTYTLEQGDDASYFSFARHGGGYKFISYLVEP